MSEEKFPDMDHIHPGYMGFHAVDDNGQAVELTNDQQKVRVHRVLYRNRVDDPNPYRITLWAGSRSVPVIFAPMPCLLDNCTAAKQALDEARPGWSDDTDPRFVDPSPDDAIHQIIAAREREEEVRRTEENAKFAGAHRAISTSTPTPTQP